MLYRGHVPIEHSPLPPNAGWWPSMRTRPVPEHSQADGSYLSEPAVDSPKVSGVPIAKIVGAVLVVVVLTAMMFVAAVLAMGSSGSDAPAPATAICDLACAAAHALIAFKASGNGTGLTGRGLWLSGTDPCRAPIRPWLGPGVLRPGRLGLQRFE